MTEAERPRDVMREAFAALDPGRRGPGACPGPKEIWDAHHGRLAPARVRELADHMSGCPSCAADWRLAMRGDQDAVVSPAPARRTLGWPSGLAVAAATLFLAVALFVVLRQQAPGFPVHRDSGGEIQSLVPENQPLPRDQVVLRWSHIGESTVYLVELATLDLEPLDSVRELQVTEYHVPPGALAEVVTPSTLVWRVEAQLSDGTTLRSDAFLVRVE